MQAYHLNIALGLMWLFLFILGYLNGFDDPSSIFYSEAKAFEQRYSQVRAAESQQFLATLDSPAVGQLPVDAHDIDENDRRLCIGIPSVKRTTESFLSNTVATLVDKLTPKQRNAIHIVVLLADKVPQTHVAYGQPWLEQLADEILIYRPHDEPLEPTVPRSRVYREIPYDVRGNGTTRGTGRVENMRMDHSVLVERCRAWGPSYFVLVEDDVVASRDWFPRLQAGLDYVERQGRDKDWVYLRLFYSEMFMGWNNEEWPSYLRTISCAYVAVLVAYLVFRRRHRGPLGGYTAVFVFGLWMPAMIGLFFAIGRVASHRISPMRFLGSGVREMPRYGCCAQGLAFPERRLDGLLELLRSPPYDFAGDQIIEGWAEGNGWTRWALEPSVLQHVGRKESSDGPRRAEVWNFSFEWLNSR